MPLYSSLSSQTNTKNLGLPRLSKSWATAVVKLIPKSTRLTEPGEFRPIALTNTVSKIFLSVVGKRLETFMNKNNYISQIQKGFKAETPGCLEHSFMMFESLLDAKMEQRQIVVTWLDLRNAYGSVRHNLLQFALNWFHVPAFVQRLIFDYYEKICAQIKTRNWSTLFFLFDIGFFQGCVLSCILFNCVFQLLLDLLKPFAEEGYHFKGSSILNHVQAFADDISVMTSTPQKNQHALDIVKSFLSWTGTMNENLKKCVSMAMKRFNSATSVGKYGDTVYCPFDPDLKIGGEKIRFIVDAASTATTLGHDHLRN
jgi:Reverse transcriptase (RNA-dependent DNA polymerase)